MRKTLPASSIPRPPSSPHEKRKAPTNPTAQPPLQSTARRPGPDLSVSPRPRVPVSSSVVSLLGASASLASWRSNPPDAKRNPTPNGRSLPRTNPRVFCSLEICSLQTTAPGVGKSTYGHQSCRLLRARGHATMLVIWIASSLRRPGSASAREFLPRISHGTVPTTRCAPAPTGNQPMSCSIPRPACMACAQGRAEAGRSGHHPGAAVAVRHLCDAEFPRKLAERGVLKGDGRVGVLGMRVDARTRAAEAVAALPSSNWRSGARFLRDTQNYVQLAAHG